MGAFREAWQPVGGLRLASMAPPTWARSDILILFVILDPLDFAILCWENCRIRAASGYVAVDIATWQHQKVCHPEAEPEFITSLRRFGVILSDAGGLQGTLWDQVASTVPEDAQPPAPGKVSQHETLAKTLLLLALVSQGVPTFPQDVLEDERLARALTALHQVRHTFASQLTPPQFETPRDLRWHGATPGTQLLLLTEHQVHPWSALSRYCNEHPSLQLVFQR